MSTLTIGLLAACAVFLVLYMMRRAAQASMNERWRRGPASVLLRARSASHDWLAGAAASASTALWNASR